MDTKILKILIVAKETVTQSFYRELITKDKSSDYQVLNADSMSAALAILKSKKAPDCIIIHACGQDSEAPALLETIAAEFTSLSFPTVLITDNPSQLVNHSAFRVQIQDYLIDSMVTKDSLVKCIHDTIEKTRLNRRIEEQELILEHLTYHDPLTNLPNRILFEANVSKTISRCKRFNRLMAILFLDIDNFKTINDAYGHHIGDQLLIQIAARIIPSIRGSDLLARLGGDEFGVILDEIEQFFGAGIFAERIMSALKAPFFVEGRQLFITTSIGIACFPESGTQAEELIKNADTAMFRVKENNGNAYQYFAAEMNTRILEFIDTKNALYDALKKHHFLVYYQPKINLLTEEICGMEALVRWQRTENNIIGPDSFISITEQLGLIIPLGYWILDQVCQDIQRWAAQDIRHRIAINLSARQLKEADFVERVGEILSRHNIDPQYVEFELTESMVMANPTLALTTLKKFKEMGIYLTVDDFGTGYSSLTYLKMFPVNALKIDRCFIQDLPEDPQDKKIVESVIALGKSLGLEVIAEGIETHAQLSSLLKLGCDHGQGYYLCNPGDNETITTFLKKHQ